MARARFCLSGPKSRERRILRLPAMRILDHVRGAGGVDNPVLKRAKIGAESGAVEEERRWRRIMAAGPRLVGNRGETNHFGRIERGRRISRRGCWVAHDQPAGSGKRRMGGEDRRRGRWFQPATSMKLAIWMCEEGNNVRSDRGGRDRG